MSAKLRRAAILNVVERDILYQNYFCQIARFGEDLKPQPSYCK